ncbi:hypothetical protein Pint_02626 [Pistacia integerrima]|uniref:Uncharacterized protein n=1 Tax=Pistacia integerrima TaxID=434235 RepID=A0ACC0ZJC3_9ROSI|nr:hypothetical protein Pint_02626 [Pistacia integerrima]
MGSREEDLHAAARSGDLKSVQLILCSNPLSLNSRDKHSRTPLHLAAWSGHTEVVSYLCKQKADVGAAAMDDMALTRKGLTPLHYAVQGSHQDLVKYLVKKGASLSAKTKAGKTPLDLARSEEIHSFLEEWEQSSKKGNQNPKEKAEGTDSMQSPVEKPENSGGEVASGIDEEQGDATLKRKGDEHDIKEASSEPKKTKVALKHLLSADDTQEDEETL